MTHIRHVSLKHTHSPCSASVGIHNRNGVGLLTCISLDRPLGGLSNLELTLLAGGVFKGELTPPALSKITADGTSPVTHRETKDSSQAAVNHSSFSRKKVQKKKKPIEAKRILCCCFLMIPAYVGMHRRINQNYFMTNTNY